MFEEIMHLALEVGLYAAMEDAPQVAAGSSKGSLSGAPVYELDDAYDLTSQIIEKDPSHAQAWFLRGAICQTRQCHEEALADLSEAIRRDRKHARALLLRSEIYFSLGDDEKGRADRESALELDPNVG
jgi:tetratricopeptide (TPR) repeat protein